VDLRRRSNACGASQTRASQFNANLSKTRAFPRSAATDDAAAGLSVRGHGSKEGPMIERGAKKALAVLMLGTATLTVSLMLLFAI
jgi:hypothetical protein